MVARISPLRILGVLALLSWCGCDSSAPPPAAGGGFFDAGEPDTGQIEDTGSQDAEPSDAGFEDAQPVDVGFPDVGHSMDAGMVVDGGPPPLLTPPDLYLALSSTGSVELRWLAASDLPGVTYAVFTSTTPDPLVDAPLLETTDTRAQIPGLQTDVTYHFAVVAHDGFGWSAPGVWISARPSLNPLRLRPENVFHVVPSAAVLSSSSSIALTNLAPEATHLQFSIEHVAAGLPAAARIVERTPVGNGVLVAFERVGLHEIIVPGSEVDVSVRSLAVPAGVPWQMQDDGRFRRTHTFGASGVVVVEEGIAAQTQGGSVAASINYERRIGPWGSSEAGVGISGRVKADVQLTLNAGTESLSFVALGSLQANLNAQLAVPRAWERERQVKVLSVKTHIPVFGPLVVTAEFDIDLVAGVSAAGRLTSAMDYAYESSFSGSLQYNRGQPIDTSWQATTVRHQFGYSTGVHATATVRAGVVVRVGASLFGLVSAGLNTKVDAALTVVAGNCGAQSLALMDLSSDAHIEVFGDYDVAVHADEQVPFWNPGPRALLRMPSLGIMGRNCAVQACRETPGTVVGTPLRWNRYSWTESDPGLVISPNTRSTIVFPPFSESLSSHRLVVEAETQISGVPITICREAGVSARYGLCSTVCEACDGALLSGDSACVPSAVLSPSSLDLGRIAEETTYPVVFEDAGGAAFDYWASPVTGSEWLGLDQSPGNQSSLRVLSAYPAGVAPNGPRTGGLRVFSFDLPGREVLLPVSANIAAPGISIVPTSPSLTTEAGGIATFTVVLDRQPLGQVSIVTTSLNPAEARVTPGVLVFTALDWSLPQTVTVTGLDDALRDGDQAYTVLLTPAESIDPTYRGMDPPDLQFVNQDDEAGIIVQAANGLFTTEAGGTATFAVVLYRAPTAAVTVALSSSDLSEGLVSLNSLSFTPANWSVPQPVIVTGVDDALPDGDQVYDIVLAPAQSPDLAYQGLDPQDVPVTNEDDELGITVQAASGLFTTEAGGTASFTVVLGQAPLGPVSIPVSSSDLLEGLVSPSNLRFSATNWSVVQTVTVTGVDDNVHDGDRGYLIQFGLAQSTDSYFQGASATDVSVTNRDDETDVVVQVMGSLVTTEVGGTASFTVALRRASTAPVTLPLSSSDLTEGTVSPASLSFSTSNWSTPQTVTLTGVDDTLPDGPQLYDAVLGVVQSADPIYQGIDPVDRPVTNQDNEIPPGYVLIPAGTFTMGSPPSELGRDNDEILRQATITGSFYMKATEVTQAEWAAVMGSNPSYFPACGGNCPVEQVTWFDGVAYMNALSAAEGLQACYGAAGAFAGLSCTGYRYPTESEWEYAARAGTTTAFHTGPITRGYPNPDPALDRAGWYLNNAGQQNGNRTTHAVAQKEVNAFGLYDMHGNVWEWTHDWYGAYSSSSVVDSVGAQSGSDRVIRGGSWNDPPRGCRSAQRIGHPGIRANYVGFRPSRSGP